MQRIVTVTALLLLSWSALAQAKPKLAIIIDDLGYDMMPREVAALPPQVSVSVIPFTEFDTAVALSALSQHREVLLHLPMQSPDGTPQEPGALTLAMTQDDISHAIREALYRVPQAVAVNNHMGSLLTEKEQPMHWVMAELKAHQLGFIDSRTTPKTVAQRIAKAHGLATNRRHVFLDHIQTRAFIDQQISLAVRQAKRRGIAVVIAHPFPVTLQTLQEVLPQLQDEVELVPVSLALKH